MTNRHFSTSNACYVILNRRRGNPLVTIVDEDQLSIMDGHPGTWCVMQKPNGDFYVYTKDYSSNAPGQQGAGTNIYLHRLLGGVDGADRSVLVDHVDGNGLNNRRENLRVTDARGNGRNRRLSDRPNSNSTTGLRNIRVAARGRYEVLVGGRYLGSTRSEAEAIRMAARGRREHYSARLQEAAQDAAQQLAAPRPVQTSDYATHMSDVSERLDRAARRAA